MVAFLDFRDRHTARKIHDRYYGYVSTSTAVDDDTPTNSTTYADLIVDAFVTNAADHRLSQQMLDNYLKNQEMIARRSRDRSAGIHAATRSTPKSPRHPTFQMYASRKRCVSRWTRPPNLWSWRK